MYVYQCDDSLEGIFTAIYNIYEDKRNQDDTCVSTTGECLLFAEYVPVISDKIKTLKVMNTLKRKFGEEDYMRICLALSANDTEKANSIYLTIANGLSANCSQGHLFDNLVNDAVHHVFSLSRGANNEFLHLRGFVRFEELENGILFSKIGPKNNVLTFLMPHFADRFPMENFMLYDDGRGLFGVHPAGKDWYLLTQGELTDDFQFEVSDNERQYRELFRYFCHKIAIKDRKNLKLQRNMLPLRFQEYMVEFDEK